MDEIKNKKKNSIGRNLVTLALIGTVAVVGISKTVKLGRNYMKRPKYWIHSDSTINFRDDLPMGMKAFIQYDKKIIEMTPRDKGSDYSRCFVIPKEALTEEEFTVHAIDMHGNRSKPKKFYTLDEVITEKKPY